MRFLALVSLTCLLLTACNPTRVAPPRTAESFFQEGEQFFESSLYQDAIASWEKVRDSYYSPELNMLAELKIAEAYFLSESYEEAASAYADFLKQHPEDSRTADVIYHLGMSYYKQILSADRDQGNTDKALKAFRLMVKKYPLDKRIEEVGFLIQRCRNRLAEHEVKVGRFYLRTKKYQAAITRLERILEVHPNYYYRDEAYFYLGQAYLKTKDKPKAADIFNRLYEEFPGSEYIASAQKILEKEY